MGKTISIYVRNNEDGPSCYYRICQYLKDLEHDGYYEFIIHNALSKEDFRKNLDLKSGYKKKILQGVLFLKILLNRYVSIRNDLAIKPDIIIIQREIFPRYLPMVLRKMLIKLLSNNVIVWDFDDDILEGKEISESEWELLQKYSKTIIATNNYLLHMVKNSKAEKIESPTTDGFFRKYDFCDCIKTRREEYDNKVRLVWVGTAVNLPNIVKLIPYIEQVSNSLHGMKKVELVIVSNVDDEAFYKTYSNFSIQYIKWTREEAEKAIISSHIGLMPLPDTTFAKGKGGFKLIQYMSAGLPVIASAVGMNCDIVTPEMGILIDNNKEWVDALHCLCSNSEIWEKYSEKSKTRYDNEYSYDTALGIWKRLIS